MIIEHGGIEKRAFAKRVTKECIATVGALSCQHTEQTNGDVLIATDAPPYDMHWFNRVDVLDKSTQPEWFKQQLSTSLESYFFS